MQVLPFWFKTLHFFTAKFCVCFKTSTQFLFQTRFKCFYMCICKQETIVYIGKRMYLIYIQHKTKNCTHIYMLLHQMSMCQCVIFQIFGENFYRSSVELQDLVHERQKENMKFSSTIFSLCLLSTFPKEQRKCQMTFINQ